MITRRTFLEQCAQAGASAGLRRSVFLWPLELGILESATNSSSPAFADRLTHLKYPAVSPLEEILQALHPGGDDFPDELYAWEIEQILAVWSKALRQDPPQYDQLNSYLTHQFPAFLFSSARVQTVRTGLPLDVEEWHFGQPVMMSARDFLGQFAALTASPSHWITAEFYVPELSVLSEDPITVRTVIQFDLVASGAHSYREEWAGCWHVEWERMPEGKWVVRGWGAGDVTKSKATVPVFTEVTAQAMAGAPTYSRQMMRSTDEWRTVLDAACGIDVYGNNGVAVGDIDGDGFDEIYVCQPAGLPNRLYLNRGDGTFEDVTEAAGVAILDDTACALFVDVDNDGHQDLLVVRAAGPLLFHNDGKGNFSLVPDAFKFARQPEGTFTGAAFADYDADGWLDVYFCLYSYYQGADQYRYPAPYYNAQNGPPNYLFRNNRNLTFTDVTTTSGLQQNNNRFSFGCTWCDFNGDGRPDLYVVNDFGQKNLYKNRGDGTFVDVASEVGVLDTGPGMSSCWIDYDNDGRPDLYVSDMWEPAGMRISHDKAFHPSASEAVKSLFRRHAKGNAIFHNRGDGTFEERSSSAQVEKAGWSWSSDTWDFDHDGWPDLLVVNGMISGSNREELESFFWRQTVSRSPLKASPSRSYEQGWNAINDLIRSDGTWNGYQRNVFYLNNRDGTFSKVSGSVGLDFQDDSRAFALSDLDHDGRLELILKNRTSPQLRILRRESSDLGTSIAFRLRGKKSNRDAVGAQISIESESSKQQKFIQAGTGFLSQHTKTLHFGFPAQTGRLRAQILWPSGLAQRLDDLPVGHIIEIEEGQAEFQATPFVKPAPGWNSVLDNSNSTPEDDLPLDTWLLDPFEAPDFELVDVKGHSWKLRDLRGKQVLLIFWSIRSKSSQDALHSLSKSSTGLASHPAQIVAVNTDGANEAAAIRSFAQTLPGEVPVLLPTEEMLGIYNLMFRHLYDRRRDLPIPCSFVIDQAGSVVRVNQEWVNLDRLLLEPPPETSEVRLRKALPFEGQFYGGSLRRNYFSLGVAFSQRGFTDQAIMFFQQVLDHNPDYADAHYNLGTLYLKKHMRAEAKAHLLEAVRLSPSNAAAFNNLGLIAISDSDTNQAIQYFEQAVTLDGSYTMALVNLGNVYRHTGQWIQAQQILESALQQDPTNADANYSLGMTLAQNGDLQKARPYLEQAIRLRPKFTAALNNLGVLFRHEHNDLAAKQTFQRCIEADPNFDQPYLNLAEMYLLDSDSVSAQRTLQQLLTRQPSNPAASRMMERVGR